MRKNKNLKWEIKVVFLPSHDKIINICQYFIIFMAKLSEFSHVPAWVYNHWMWEESRKKQQEIRAAIHQVTKDQNVAIGVTGSDGRFENPAISHTLWTTGQVGSEAIKSNPELVIIHNWLMNSDQKCEIQEWILANIQNNTRYILDWIEWKNIENDSAILYRNDPNRAFPTRLWDLAYIQHDPEIIEKILWKSIDEIHAQKKVIKHFQDRLRYHQKITREWWANYHQHWNQSIDYENGRVFFTPENNPSIKNGPLRVLQYSLALGVMKSIANQKFHMEQLTQLPSNIHERLTYLESNDLTHLTLWEIEELQEIYSYFLQLYHKILALYGIGGLTEFELAPNTKQELIEQRDMLMSDKYAHTKLIRI